ncbi:MAG TPA: hypothetical protein VHD84_01535 [Candidatus Saccharimonadales bacterium]|nr:hypothetical protein [Candidatus Saccharimonadales bacterium]
MKVLLVNNRTQHLDYLLESLAGHDIEIIEYEPGVKLDDEGKDLILLSGGGGEGLEIDDKYRRGKLWYDDQMEFIRNADKPIVGICMGFEVIARAFGAPVKEMKKGLVHGYFRLVTTPAGHKALGKDRLLQFKAHSWHVPSAPDGFEILADSPDGIEIIRHKTRPIIATQFHPEKGGTFDLDQIIKRGLAT